jgi:hypothetical protein
MALQIRWWDSNFKGKILINTRVYDLKKRCRGCTHLTKRLSFEDRMSWCEVSRAIATANMFDYPVTVVE